MATSFKNALQSMGNQASAVDRLGLSSSIPLPYDSNDQDLDSERCSICKENMGQLRSDGEEERAVILPCSHIFGHICISHWLSSSPWQNCPSCRREMIYTMCGHPIQPYPISEAPPAVNQDNMPGDCWICRLRKRGRSVADDNEDVLLMRKMQAAEEKALEEMKTHFPRVFGSLARQTVQSVPRRVEESRVLLAGRTEELYNQSPRGTRDQC